MHLIPFLMLLIPIVGIVGLAGSSSAAAISTSTETDQVTNQVKAADNLKDQLSAQLRSIVDTAPLTVNVSEGPFYSENVTRQAASYLSERLSIGMLSGDGVVKPPNSTSLLNFTSTGTEITDSSTSAVISNGTMTLESDNEPAKVSMFQIAHYRSDDGIPRKAVIAIFATNSTGQLAPLDGMIGIGESELSEGGDMRIKLWALS